MIDVRLRLQGLDLQRTCEEGAGSSPCWAGLGGEPLSRGLAGSAMAQAGRMACCVVHLHSSGREHNLGLKLFNYYPSPHPFTPQRGETCRITLPIGTLAEGGHTHIQHMP